MVALGSPSVSSARLVWISGGCRQSRIEQPGYWIRIFHRTILNTIHMRKAMAHAAHRPRRHNGVAFILTIEIACPTDMRA
jgi:hypothetical protein